MFLIGNIPGNLITGISLTQVVTDLWLKTCKILICAHPTEVNCDFWVPLKISDQIHRILCQSCFIFFLENAQRLQK